MLSVDALPSVTKTVTFQLYVSNWPSKRTIHDYFHVVHKPVDYFQGLCDGHPALFLSETVKPL